MMYKIIYKWKRVTKNQDALWYLGHVISVLNIKLVFSYH